MFIFVPMKKRITFLSFILILTASISYAQVAQPDADPKEKTPFKDRIFTGGNLGLGFGNYT